YVDVCLRQKDDPTQPQAVYLERDAGDLIDIVDIWFDKYGRPSFQISGARRSAAPPHEFVRHGNLVRGPNQYMHLWGKLWLPLISPRAVAAEVRRRLPQIFELLENGVRGRAISKPIDWSPQKPQEAS